jgi:predicted transcriptional regulator
MLSPQKNKTFIYIVTYIVAMVTTIQISQELLSTLKEKKLYNKESYEEVIWDALEDSMELSDETKKRIKLAEADIKAGRIYSLDDVKKELGI